MSGAANQQERLILAYLAGIIDGEGWIGLTKSKNTEVRCGFTITPQISIHMVGKDHIEKIDAMFRKAGLPSYYIHLKSSSRWSVRGWTRVTPVIDELQPFLLLKGKQALLLREYSYLRMLRPHHSGPTPRELRIVDEVCALNTKGKNPQRLYA